MKAVELRYSEKESKFPIKNLDQLSIYSEYFLVDKIDNNEVFILRYFEDINTWYLVSLNSFITRKLTLSTSIKSLCDTFYIYSIPEYTGGSDGINMNEKESDEERKKLLEFLIENYL